MSAYPATVTRGQQGCGCVDGGGGAVGPATCNLPPPPPAAAPQSCKPHQSSRLPQPGHARWVPLIPSHPRPSPCVLPLPLLLRKHPTPPITQLGGEAKSNGGRGGGRTRICGGKWMVHSAPLPLQPASSYPLRLPAQSRTGAMTCPPVRCSASRTRRRRQRQRWLCPHGGCRWPAGGGEAALVRERHEADLRRSGRRRRRWRRSWTAPAHLWGPTAAAAAGLIYLGGPSYSSARTPAQPFPAQPLLPLPALLPLQLLPAAAATRPTITAILRGHRAAAVVCKISIPCPVPPWPPSSPSPSPFPTLTFRLLRTRSAARHVGSFPAQLA